MMTDMHRCKSVWKILDKDEFVDGCWSGQKEMIVEVIRASDLGGMIEGLKFYVSKQRTVN